MFDLKIHASYSDVEKLWRLEFFSGDVDLGVGVSCSSFIEAMSVGLEYLGLPGDTYGSAMTVSFSASREGSSDDS